MLQPGDRIERYTIVAALGEGGMGQVYRAKDERLQRLVALKVLRSESGALGAFADGPARILREARAAAALHHDHVVAIYDVGTVPSGEPLAGTAYIAMELIEGRSLRQWIMDGSAPMSERLRWIADVARAIAAAHARGLVHRDIKPENVMIRDDGVVKVLDFGIAQRAHPELVPVSTTEAQVISTMSTSGGVAGTPLYMAPEQMRNEPLDGRVDQFSWGVLAYELCARELPWGGGIDKLQMVANMMSKDATPLTDRGVAVPAHVSRTIARALAKRPSDRFASMKDVILSLAGDTALVDTERAPSALAPPPVASSMAESVPAIAPLAYAPTLRAEQGAPAAAAPSRRTRARAFAIAGVAVAAIGVAWLTRGAWSSTTATPASSAPSSAAPASAGVASLGGCASNTECIARANGAASICRRSDGACALLASQDCRVFADSAAIDSDDTVWFGAMFPLSGDDADNYGTSNAQAIDLARRDFAQMMSGFEKGGALGRVRPFGIVACDDVADARRAARHLVDDVRAPAVIGFRTAAELIDVAGSTLIPSDVLAIATLTTSPLVANIPHRAGQPRLVWRTTYNSTQTAAAIGVVVPQLFEPDVRARGLGAKAAMRVALVRSKATRLSAFSNALFSALSFNGKSALDNGTSYRELVFDEVDGEAQRADYRALTAELLAYAPHVVVYVGDDALPSRLIEPVERAWRGPEAQRPRWMAISTMPRDVMRFVGADASRRRRFFGVAEVTTAPANARFVMHYNEVFPKKVTRSVAPNSSYDAFYVLAYATYALGDDAVTGASLSRAIGRLVPPGLAVDVGVAGIFDAFSALRRGENIDLNGATGSLDFDLATGEAKVDQAILCVGVDDAGRASDSVESGAVWSARTQKLEGAMRCP